MSNPSQPRGPEAESAWNTLAVGDTLSVTVLMAADFTLDPERPIREHYRIAAELGEGAMGKVFAVELRDDPDKSRYALKVVALPAGPPSFDDAPQANEPALPEARTIEAVSVAQARTFAELLRQEAVKQKAAQRNGVTVARLFTLVRLDNGALGMRMELARGKALERVIEEERANLHRPPDVARAFRLVRKLLSQLRRLHTMREPAHPEGFVHSDIKPGNIYVDESDPSDPVLTLLDFGVATAGRAAALDFAHAEGGRTSFIFRGTGGTPGYVPPGHFLQGARAYGDVHAALVVLYELIALDSPWDFPEEDLRIDNREEWEGAMLRGPLPLRRRRFSVPDADAKLLDEFFVREFRALHDPAFLEEQVALAETYQQRLDALSVRIEEGRRSGVQRRERDRERETLPPMGPVSDRPPPMGEKSELPVALPLAFLAPVVLLGAGLFFYSRPSTPTTTVIDAGRSAHSDASAPHDVVELRDVQVPNDARSPAAVMVSDAEIPVENRGARVLPVAVVRPRPVDEVSDAAVAQEPMRRCSCIGPAANLSIIASGAGLSAPMTVCTTRDAINGRTIEFLGEGRAPVRVLEGRPTLFCTGGDRPLTVVTQRFSVDGELSLQFRCQPSPTSGSAGTANSDAGESAQHGSAHNTNSQDGEGGRGSSSGTSTSGNSDSPRETHGNSRDAGEHSSGVHTTTDDADTGATRVEPTRQLDGPPITADASTSG